MKSSRENNAQKEKAIAAALQAPETSLFHLINPLNPYSNSPSSSNSSQTSKKVEKQPMIEIFPTDPKPIRTNSLVQPLFSLPLKSWVDMVEEEEQKHLLI